MGILRPIPSPQRVDDADDFPAFFKPSRDHGVINQVRDQRIRGDENVCPGNENRKKEVGERLEEAAQRVLVFIGQDGKPRQRPALAAVKRRRNSPNASPTILHLLELARGVFEKAIRRIGDNRMDGVPLGLS